MTGTCSLISSSNKSTFPSSGVSRWVDSNHQPRNFKFPCSAVGIHRVKVTSLSLSLLGGTSCQLVLRQQRRGCTSQKLENNLWPCLESNQTSPINTGVLPLIRKVWFSNLKMARMVGHDPTRFPARLHATSFSHCGLDYFISHEGKSLYSLYAFTSNFYLI